MNWLAIFVGGGIGAVLRFALATFVVERAPTSFPWGTFSVNVVGCLVIGLVATLAEERGMFTVPTRLFLITGVLGGFTTFSAFGLETWRLLEHSQVWIAMAYSLGSLSAGLVAMLIGVALGRWLF